MDSNWRTKRSYPVCSPTLAVIVFATPVFPPEASAQAKAGTLVPGGVGGVTGGWEMRGPDAMAAVDWPPPGLTAALGVSWGPQAARIASRAAATAIRTDE